MTASQSIRTTAADNGHLVSVTVGDTVTVALGAGWTAPQVRPLGGDPGPVSTPLLNQPDTTPAISEATFTAVSAGQALIIAQATTSCGGTHASPCAPFELTIHVQPRAGMQAPLSAGQD